MNIIVIFASFQYFASIENYVYNKLFNAVLNRKKIILV